MDSADPVRILILGGGFAGVSTAVELERLFRRSPTVEITLVNRENFTLFTPMLHEIAASDIDLTHVVNPLRKLTRRVRLLVGTVEAIDVEARRVTVAHGAERHGHELEYDHLVVALGATTNFFGIPGLAERALTMKSLGDAIHLRNRLIRLLEEADFECRADARRSLLTLVVAGAGFAGVETAAAINDFLREAVPFYRNLRESDLRLVLVHAGAQVLPELSRALGDYAQAKLAERGVEVRLGTRVTGLTDERVVLSDGTEIEARTLVWTAGTAAHPLIASLPCELEHGRLRVDAQLRVLGRPGVWALGDCAAIPDANGGTYPPTAQHAVREGRVLARNLYATLRQEPLRPFTFSTLGQLAAIGRRTGVANILGRNFSGFVAWWLWRSIYLAKLPRLEKKVRVALDWTLDLLFSKDLVQFDVERTSLAAEAAARIPAPPAIVGDTTPLARRPAPAGVAPPAP